MSGKLNVFVSYSHKDAAWLERVQVHLQPLARDGRLELWDDTRIETGQRWRDEIDEALDVAILLISADFLHRRPGAAAAPKVFAIATAYESGRSRSLSCCSTSS